MNTFAPESELVSATIDISRLLPMEPRIRTGRPGNPAEDISEEAVSTSASPKTGSWQGTAIQAEKLTLPGLPAREDNAVIASLWGTMTWDLWARGLTDAHAARLQHWDSNGQSPSAIG